MILFVFEGKDDKTYFESIKPNYVETEECKVAILNELPIPSSTTLEER